MTNEEMQKAIEFIVNQQAQFTSDIQVLQEGQKKLVESQLETNNLLNRLATATLKGFEDVNTKIDALVDAQVRTEETLSSKIDALADAQIRADENLNAKINTLVEAQTRTDEVVRNLAEIVDRQLRERRNGG
jgi:hypothetical protein